MLTKLFQRLTRSEPKVWRQGDVFLVSIHSLPTGLTGLRPVLAEGELTGHAHRIADPSTAQVLGGKGSRYLHVSAESANIVHDEHEPIVLPRGSYDIRIQREYHPKEIRRVTD